MQAQTGRAASIPSQTRSCVVPDSRISTHLRIPPQSPWDSLYDLHLRTAWNYTRVCRTYTEAPLWCFFPLTYFSLRHESIFEIRLWKFHEGERESGPSNLAREGEIRAWQVFDSRSQSVDFILISSAERERAVRRASRRISDCCYLRHVDWLSDED